MVRGVVCVLVVVGDISMWGVVVCGRNKSPELRTRNLVWELSKVILTPGEMGLFSS